jgi:hypothetical protein
VVSEAEGSKFTTTGFTYADIYAMMLGSKDPQLFLENLIFYSIYKLFGLS